MNRYNCFDLGYVAFNVLIGSLWGFGYGLGVAVLAIAVVVILRRLENKFDSEVSQ